jgi:hypothetical protein
MSSCVKEAVTIYQTVTLHPIHQAKMEWLLAHGITMMPEQVLDQ